MVALLLLFNILLENNGFGGFPSFFDPFAFLDLLPCWLCVLPTKLFANKLWFMLFNMRYRWLANVCEFKLVWNSFLKPWDMHHTAAQYPKRACVCAPPFLNSGSPVTVTPWKEAKHFLRFFFQSKDGNVWRLLLRVDDRWLSCRVILRGVLSVDLRLFESSAISRSKKSICTLSNFGGIPELPGLILKISTEKQLENTHKHNSKNHQKYPNTTSHPLRRCISSTNKHPKNTSTKHPLKQSISQPGLPERIRSLSRPISSSARAL